MKGKIVHNKSILFMFVFSFFMTFVVLYEGMDQVRQVKQVEAECAKEECRYYLEIYLEEITGDLTECHIKNGNIYLWIEKTVGEDVYRPITVECLFVQNEPIAQGLITFDYYSDVKGKEDCYFVGRGWEKELHEKKGKKYITLDNKECLVAGYLKPNDIESFDTRCIEFPLSMDGFRPDEDTRFVYKSNESDSGKEMLSWMSEFGTYDEENIDYQGPADLAGFVLGQYQGILGVMVKILYVFCIVNAGFLAYFWGRKKLYEYMLKRTLGYSRGKIFAEILARFTMLEGFSLVLALVGTFAYELLRGRVENWWANMQYGFGTLVIGFLILGLVISLLPMIWIVKSSPIKVLRSNE